METNNDGTKKWVLICWSIVAVVLMIFMIKSVLKTDVDHSMSTTVSTLLDTSE